MVMEDYNILDKSLFGWISKHTMQQIVTKGEVYKQVLLLVENEKAKRWVQNGEKEDTCNGDGEDADSVKRLVRIPDMFCKTFTSSDTSTYRTSRNRAVQQKTASCCWTKQESSSKHHPRHPCGTNCLDYWSSAFCFVHEVLGVCDAAGVLATNKLCRKISHTSKLLGHMKLIGGNSVGKGPGVQILRPRAMAGVAMARHSSPVERGA